MPIFSYSLKKIVVIIYLEPQLIITVLPNWHRDQINEIIIQLEPKPINNWRGHAQHVKDVPNNQYK